MGEYSYGALGVPAPPTGAALAAAESASRASAKLFPDEPGAFRQDAAGLPGAF
ncbi:hypothetical protein ACF09E_11245 [Streptomyces sp. NPDC014891]|uniref:hypothetical protein n=1 Tax=Streptomyces sp. NPDC014891 TaxID=3364929 RepID=UPI0036F591F9